MIKGTRMKGTGWTLISLAGGVDACLNEASTANVHAAQLIPAQNMVDFTILVLDLFFIRIPERKSESLHPHKPEINHTFSER